MADSSKYQSINGSELRRLFSLVRTRRTVTFSYGCICAFILFTIFLAASPWFATILSSGVGGGGSAIVGPTSGSYRSQFSDLIVYFFPNSTGSTNSSILNLNQTNPDLNQNPSPPMSYTTITAPFTPEVPKQRSPPPPARSAGKNPTQKPPEIPPPAEKQRPSLPPARITGKTPTQRPPEKSTPPEKQRPPPPPARSAGKTPTQKLPEKAPPVEKQRNGSVDDWANCKLYDGDWVKDESYPLYKPGSCSIIDPQFSCISNGRPDKEYLKYKWKPHGCSLPRLNASRMLNMLRGKRLVFVGDSLNRNMWESMVCILRNAAKDQTNVYEAHGRRHFRGEAEFSFVFKDYNFTVEFYVSPFLVQEWEVHDNKSGVKKETLRLDLIGKSCDDYKSADVLVFNTGHWWTHEKTSLGKGYYQEGSHVYGELNVLEAFRKALTTWARWVDANVNSKKTAVFFRGYSASHFSGGQWNSGGACDNETHPITNHSYLSPYPPKMTVLEKVLKNMKTRVSYLNITQLTDYRKDGHPSIYRKKDLPESEKKAPLRFQDCSHWCLPGVPDAWNELLYAELLVRERKNRRE